MQLLGACENPQRRCSVHGDRQEMWPLVRVPECIIAGPLSHRAAPAASADPRQAVANKQTNKQTRANPTTELDEDQSFQQNVCTKPLSKAIDRYLAPCPHPHAHSPSLCLSLWTSNDGSSPDLLTCWFQINNNWRRWSSIGLE